MLTGFKSNKNDSSLNNQSNTCSTALVTALLTLTGHVKQVNDRVLRLYLIHSSLFQCALSSKGQPNQDTGTLKEQLSVVIKAQLDFQQKIENQMSMMQAMMQTVCQLVNNELITNKKCPGNCTPQTTALLNSARNRRDPTDFSMAEPRQNWTNNNNSHMPVQKARANSTDEIITLTQRTSSGRSSFSSSI